MGNCDTPVNSTEQNVPVAVAFGLVIAVGFPLNVVSLWILLRHHSFKTPNIVFMVNLVISDLLLTISLPTKVYFYATGVWGMGHIACIFAAMLFRNNIRSSSIFITFICIDRLLAVVFPVRSRHLRTPSNAWKAAAITWLLLLTMNTPESVTLMRSLEKIRNASNVSACFEIGGLPSSPFPLFQPILVLSMLAVNVVCTALVSWTLWMHLSDFARVNKKVNVMVIFIVNLLMFAVFFVPLSVYFFLPCSLKIKRVNLLVLGSVNCCMDPLHYYFSLDGFWKRKDTAARVSENSRQVEVALNT